MSHTSLTVPGGSTDQGMGVETASNQTAARRSGWIWVLCGFLVLAALVVDPLRGWLREWPGRWSHILAVSVTMTACLTPLTRKLAFRLGAVDKPDRRKVHDRPTPRFGGLAVVAGIVAALAINGIPDPSLTLLLVAGVGLMIVGAADDMNGLSARLRLLSQVVASLVVIQGGVILTVFPHEALPGTILNGALTLLWLVGITNAFNFFDGMDGLAGGLAVVMAGFLGTIAFLTGQPQLGWASVAMVGAALGFLPYNFRACGPARVFLGDGGSTALGFLLAGLAVHGEWAVGHPLVNVSAPLLIFGVLIFDMIHTTVARIVRGDVRTFRQWIEYTGRDHLHHRFESLLRSKRKAVLLIHLLAVTLCLTALLIRRVSLEGSILLLVQCVAILLIVTILEYAGNLHERRRR
jgi:UDP-GlcNAc:undecaprenyl-phosphate GlcNAc-1-phosphate transferase